MCFRANLRTVVWKNFSSSESAVNAGGGVSRESRAAMSEAYSFQGPCGAANPGRQDCLARLPAPQRSAGTPLLLLRHLGKVGKPEMPAEVGQGLQIDVAHQVADGELPGFAGQDGDAGNLALLVARQIGRAHV